MRRSIGLPTLLAIILVALGTLAPAPSALAAVTPVPGSSDPRVRVVAYASEQVVLLEATFGYALAIQFEDGERLETVSVGDSIDWQLLPNKRANVLFVKPVRAARPTNMTVVTNLRVYQFELRSRKGTGPRDRGLIFSLRFDYPAPALATLAQDMPPPPEEIREANSRYTWQGSTQALPVKVFDDGTVTYFRFARTTDLPAIFAIDRDGKEAAVNVAFRGDYLVVDRLAQAFVLRRGGDVTRIINEGFASDAAAETTLAPYRKPKKQHKQQVKP